MCVELVPVPRPDEPPGEGLEAVAAVERAHHFHLVGHADIAEDATTYAVGYRSQSTTQKHYLLARDEAGRPLATASVQMPLKDNEQLGYLFLSWVPGGSCEGEAYAALWAQAQPIFDHGGRQVIHSWAMHPVADVGQGHLEPRSGSGRLGRDDRAAWLERTGFRLEQVELASTLDVTPTALTAAREILAATSTAPYLLQSWTGATPPELRAGMAWLRSRMSVDAPGADLDYEEEQWDEAQILALDQRREDVGRLTVTTVALHSGSGNPVAYTEIAHPRDRPAVAIQDDTLVHGDHRGHRLGLLIKATALLELAQAAPTVKRIHTWNAAENTHMLAINARLGFRQVGVQGGWQLRR